VLQQLETVHVCTHNTQQAMCTTEYGHCCPKDRRGQNPPHRLPRSWLPPAAPRGLTRHVHIREYQVKLVVLLLPLAQQCQRVLAARARVHCNCVECKIGAGLERRWLAGRRLAGCSCRLINLLLPQAPLQWAAARGAVCSGLPCTGRNSGRAGGQAGGAAAHLRSCIAATWRTPL